MNITVEHDHKSIEIPFPISDLGLTIKLKKIGMTDIVPVCRIIKVSEDAEALTIFRGKEVNLDELNFLIRRLEGLDDYQYKLFRLCCSRHMPITMEKMINLTYSLQGLSFITDFSNPDAVARQLAEDEYGEIMEDEDDEEIDYFTYAEECLREREVHVYPEGVYVEHGYVYEEVYTGRALPELTDSEINNLAAVAGLRNSQGEDEYLYLPTSKYALDKVKARLGFSYFSECSVAWIVNYGLPKILVPDTSDISDITSMEKFNEMCEAFMGLKPEQMEAMKLIAEFVGRQEISTMTNMIRNISEFEAVPEVLSDKEYGKYLVFKSDMGEVDERLTDYIHYEQLAKDTRKQNFKQSGFTEHGFVGCTKEPEAYQNYTGACREPLEVNEEECITLRLYSPLYAQQYIDGEYAGNMEGDELTYYAEDIMKLIEERTDLDEEFRGLMIYMGRDMAVSEKVISAFPKVERIGKTLYGVLECKCRAALNEYEMSVLKDYWAGQMSDGWGEGFEQQEIRIDDGEIFVSFYSSSGDWCVMTEEELEMKGIIKSDMQHSCRL